MSLEKFGQYVGETIGKKGLEFLERKVDNFDIKAVGLENLEILKEEACLLASNHIKPEGKIAESSGISPDAFIISRLVEQETGQKIKIAQKSDDGWWANNSIWKQVQKKITQPFGRGFSVGLGNIPVQKNPSSSNKTFLKLIKKTVEAQESLLVFPEGAWYEDFDESHEMNPGASHIAKKHNLKIIPVYINGANGWEDGKKVSVFFGQPFSIEGLSKKEITIKIKENISLLQSQDK
jgi:hypothetical protein